MTDPVSIVTGASRGIGFYTARALVLRGFHAVLIGHHRGRGEDALERIRRAQESEAGEPRGSTSFALVDLSAQDEIRDFARSFRAEHERLDVLVNNAGGFFMERQETVDGIELTFALNHLNYFLLTNLLLHLLRKTGERKADRTARIVNVASDAHRNTEMHFEDLELHEGYGGRRAYNQSKLANLLFTYELDRRLAGEPVTVNALHPGFVNTQIGKQNWLVGAVLSVLHFFFAKSPEEGAETPIYVATSPEVEGVSGKYFVDKEPVRSSDVSYEEEAARRLWEISERMTGL